MFASAAMPSFDIFSSARKSSIWLRASAYEFGPCLKSAFALPIRALATVEGWFAPALAMAFSNAWSARSQLRASISASPAFTNWLAV